MIADDSQSQMGFQKQNQIQKQIKFKNGRRRETLSRLGVRRDCSSEGEERRSEIDEATGLLRRRSAAQVQRYRDLVWDFSGEAIVELGEIKKLKTLKKPNDNV